MCQIFLALFFSVPNTSSFFTMYSSFKWMLGHSSRICCWVSGVFLHTLHVRFSYLLLKLFLCVASLFWL